MIKFLNDFNKLKIQKLSLFFKDSKFNNINVIKVLTAKMTIRTHLLHYNDDFDFNSNIKIM